MDGLYEGQEWSARRLVERNYWPEDKSRLTERVIRRIVRAIPVLVFISTLAAALLAGGNR